MKQIVSRWNRAYFEGRLSNTCLAELDLIDTEDEELTAFVDNFLFYLHEAGCPAEDLSPLGARFLAQIAKSYMPSLWGKIPPITREGRLRVMDRVAHHSLSIAPNDAIRFLDVGCGYPPVTTIETARACPGWSCVGIDPNFPALILTDTDADTVGCFDESGRLVYIQYLKGPLQPALEVIERDQRRLVSKWSEIQTHASLRERFLADGRLIHHPEEQYEGDNLAFVASDLVGLQDCEPFDLVRCMNVFMYYSGREIIENIRHTKHLLNDLAFFICGNAPEVMSSTARYLAFQKKDSDLVPVLYGIDLAKLSRRDGNGWWAFHKDQPDTLFLAKLISFVAGNQELHAHLINVVDRLERELGYSERDSDGFLQQRGFISSTADNDQLNQRLAEECGQEIQDYLRSNGLHADITPYAHLVIDLTRTTNSFIGQYFPVL